MGVCCCCVGTCCLNQQTAKVLEITSIVLHSISIILLLISLIIIPWKEIYTANLAFFIIMFLICIIGLIMLILLRVWRSNDSIKSTKKGTGISLATAGIVIEVINYIICIIEEILILVSFSRVNYPCYKYERNSNYYYAYRRISTDVDCTGRYSDYYSGIIKNSSYIIVYLSFSYFEIALIFHIVIWVILKTRIRLGIDGQPATTIPSPVIVGNTYDPYGRAVVVIPQEAVIVGNQYQYGSPYAYGNQQIVHQQNPQYPSSNDYQLQEKIS